MNSQDNALNGINLNEVNDLQLKNIDPDLLLTTSANFTPDQYHLKSAFLLQKLSEVQDKLKEKEKECESLTRFQLQTGEEVEELTATLFEEANKMVQDANIKRVHAENKLEDALTKIEILQAEVTSLKKLVLSSTPTSPNCLKIPQLVKSPSNPMFLKTHKRSVSHHSTIKFFDDSENMALIDIGRREKFTLWKARPNLNVSDPFINDIIKNEINPCLASHDNDVKKKLLDGILNNTLAIEPIGKFASNGCSLSECPSDCTYVVKLENIRGVHYPVSTFIRNKIASICNLVSYLRYITLGLVKTSEDEMFNEIIHYLLQMSVARLGLET